MAIDREASGPRPGGAGLAGWTGWRTGVAPLIIAAILGLLIAPAVVDAVKDRDVLISGRLSLIGVVWLVIALALGVVCLVARSGLDADVGRGVRRLIAGTQPTAARRSGVAAPDTPALGVAIVGGIFNLVVLFIIQGMIRAPLVRVASAYAPGQWIDGAFVALVVVIALAILFGLYGASRPLTEHLVAVGLDHLVPTAGFAGSDLPNTPASRLATRATGPSGTLGQPGQSAEPTVAASAAPTVAAEPTRLAESSQAATVLADSEATVAENAPVPPVDSSETIAAPLEATVIEQAPRPVADSEATVEESPGER